MYDSTKDTQEHIARVAFYLGNMAGGLFARSIGHDASKLVSPEKEAFDRETPLLKNLTFGSPEYDAAKVRLGTALNHHYLVNSHHPEHYAYWTCDVNSGEEGEECAYDKESVVSGEAISYMSLLDITEMLCDWKAASERHADGNIVTSIEKNVVNFGITPQLASILWYTALEQAWIDPEDIPLVYRPAAN